MADFERYGDFATVAVTRALAIAGRRFNNAFNSWTDGVGSATVHAGFT